MRKLLHIRHWLLLATDDDGAVGVVNDVVTDTAHESTAQSVETSSSNHNRRDAFMFRNTADHRARLVTELEPERPVYLNTLLHNLSNELA